METPCRWYHPQTPQDALNAIENTGDLAAFLSDIVSQDTRAVFRFSEEGQNGFYCILALMEETLKDAARILVNT